MCDLALGWEQQPVDTEKNLTTVRGAVREQWQRAHLRMRADLLDYQISH